MPQLVAAGGSAVGAIEFAVRILCVSATVRLMAVNIVPGDFFAGIPEAIRVHKRHLKALMKALKARDGESAEREIISMLRQDAGLVIALLTERGVIGQDAIGGTDAAPPALRNRRGRYSAPSHVR